MTFCTLYFSLMTRYFIINMLFYPQSVFVPQVCSLRLTLTGFNTENMAGNLKGNYNAKFLEAIGFAFKKCQLNFVPKVE